MTEKDLKQIADKKKAIFDSTLELIKENGFHGTPMSQVAKKANVACGTIYHYFDSKDTLILQLHDYIREQMIDALLNQDDEKLDFKERTFGFWRRHFQFYTNNPDYLFFMEQFVNSPYHAQSIEKPNLRLKTLSATFIEKGIKTKILKPLPIELLTVMMHSNIITAAKIYLGTSIPMSLANVEQYFEFIWDGITNQHAK